MGCGISVESQNRMYLDICGALLLAHLKQDPKTASSIHNIIDTTINVNNNAIITFPFVSIVLNNINDTIQIHHHHYHPPEDIVQTGERRQKADFCIGIRQPIANRQGSTGKVKGYLINAHIICLVTPVQARSLYLVLIFPVRVIFFISKQQY